MNLSRLRVSILPRLAPALWFVCAFAPPTNAAPLTLPPDAVHPGDRAVVRTVFEGARIDSFEAVILGVLDSGRSEGVMILARATSESAIRSGVAQGMSGSPVTVNGKLIGALSSGFSFSREPVFGITPIGEMLEVLDHPDATRDTDPSTGMSGFEPGNLAAWPRFREMRWACDVDHEPATPRPVAAADPAANTANLGIPTRLALPLACTGLVAGAEALVRDWLAPLGFTAVPGGRATSSSAAPLDASALQPGSPVAIDVLRGDLLMTAIGTVTWREGDRVLMFGHPLFQAGDARMPMATATIATIVPSGQISFKLGQRGRDVGAILQDRRPAVFGRVGAVAHMLPFRVRIAPQRGSEQRFAFETVEDRTLAPLIVGIASMNGLLESGGTGAGQTLRWSLRMNRSGHEPLVLSDVVAGDNPVSDLAQALASPLRFLFANPYTQLRLDSLSVDVAVVPGRQAWTLRSAHVLEPTVRPGERVHVMCELEAWRGTTVQRSLTLTVPNEVPDGRYTLWLGGGAELSRYEAARLPGRYRATSLDDAWRRLAHARSSDALYGALFARAPELNDDGRDYPELPMFALSLLAGDQMADDHGRRGDLAWLDEQRVKVDGGLRGELQLNVVVQTAGTLAQP